MTVCFSVQCDIGLGKEEYLDELLTEQVKPFWMAQPGVSTFRVINDTLEGHPG